MAEGRRVTGHLDHRALRHLLVAVQDGVVSRAQLKELGADDSDVERMLRRRELVVVVPGVYLCHTGEPTRSQREWVAVLACWPAVLCGPSALPGASGPVVHVAVARDRGSLRAVPGVRVTRTAHLEERAAWHRSPPRLRVEHAAIDVASALLARDRVASAFATLADTCYGRTTTPARILAVLDQRPRVVGRRLLLGLLRDLADGTGSELERGYLHRVERAHGLPVGRRQVRHRADGRSTYTDVEYEGFSTIVELDGRVHHEGVAARDRDAHRDLLNLVETGAATARLTWGLVFDDGCRTAALVERLLHRGGWGGRLRPCPACRRAA